MPRDSSYGSAAMEFRILGPLEVSAGDGALKVGGPKQRAVLAHLILRANHPVPVELLIDGLWGEEPPETAKSTLQTYVYRLRQLLGEDRIGSDGGGYVLRAEPEEIDAARFEAMVRAAKAELPTDPAKAAAALTDALAMWRGAPLSDLSEEPSLRGEIARLEELHLSATEHRIAAEIAMGGHSTVVSELEALTARYPLRERMWANLTLALYRLGRQAEALAAYQRAREVLADELGAEPSAELQHLHEQILRRDPSLGGQEPPKPKVKPSRVDLQPGTEFAGYRIVNTLGRGGMAVVYLAEHDFLQRKVALKVLAPQLAEDERFRERFVRESRLAASLDHPNVVPIYEAGATGGDLFIAMRYVEGTDLRTLLAESGALDPSRAVSICRQVAAALDAAHEQGLVHRDVKPGNVLVARARGSEAGEHVYLSDFGLTKRSASESGVTGTGQFVGTLDYAAPEQFQGGTPDARTDVYSLGCVLFECLTGRPPFRAENDAGLMYAHLQEQPPSVAADRPELPKEIDAVIARAMAKAAGDRQPSAGVLAAEAARALHVGVPSEAGAGGRGSPLRRLVPVLAVAAALVVGVVVTLLVQNDTPQAAGPASQPSPTASPSPTVEPAFKTTERPLTANEDRLLAAIPAGANAGCLPLDRPEPIQGELAALVCHPKDVEVLYELFPTQSDMNAAFLQGVNTRQAPDGECATDPLAVTPYTIGGNPAGSVLCYTVEGGTGAQFIGAQADEEIVKQSHIEWTDENSSIYAHAVRHDLADLSLYQWWLTSSGPVVTNDGTAVEKDPPAALEPVLTDGSYMVSISERDQKEAGESGFVLPEVGFGTVTMNLHEGSYEIGVNGEFPETGTVSLRKPNSVVFAPNRAPCGIGVSLGPVTYEWTTKGSTVTWEKVGGEGCAGPQPFTGIPWIRGPDGLIALSQGGAIRLSDPAGFVTDEVVGLKDTNPNGFPDWSPDGTTIAFAGSDQQGADLYAVHADGTGRTRLTDAAGDELAPDWSPDGGSIAFVFDDGADVHWRAGIAVTTPGRADWTELVARDEQSFWEPVWSPDGKRIAFTILEGAQANAPNAYVMDADGGNLVDLSSSLATVVSWTPDGSRIVLSKAGDLVSVKPDGTGERVLLGDAPEFAKLTAEYSPDGKWLTMSSSPRESSNGHLYLMRVADQELFLVGSGITTSWRPEGP